MQDLQAVRISISRSPIYLYRHENITLLIDILQSKEAVTALFRVVGRPSQCTPMRSNLAAILEPYVKNYEQFANNPSPDTMLKPCNLIIVTDGDCSTYSLRMGY